ncbi:cyclin-D1-binding protein 1 [Heteronotia binoei]|uniref:cyclin-D1-binding protein 1 n=1 Tax=Heteronotia binoei TaxID=13085 RepID=UPI00292DC202|nr:cyclin-D1-binding protein 1 [Heteronotia binoei]
MEAAAGLRGALRAVLAGLPGGGGQAPAAAAEASLEGGLERADVWAEALAAASRAATQLSLAAASGPQVSRGGGAGREGLAGASRGRPLPSSPFFSQDLELLSGEAERAVLAAAAVYQGLPEDRGRTLRRAVGAAVGEVAEGLLRLTDALHLLLASPSAEQQRRVATGGVWEACERAAALPRDPPAAVASALASCLAVVGDALREMEQALVEGGGPYQDVPEEEEEEEEVAPRGNREVCWSEADRRLLDPCVGLVKAAKACLKKILGAVKALGKADTAEQVAQLDDLADAAGDVSPSVDELVLSIYPPVNQLTLRLNAAKLAAVLKKMLEVTWASHVCVPSEESWVQFLSGAVDHNMDKIKELTQGGL